MTRTWWTRKRLEVAIRFGGRLFDQIVALTESIRKLDRRIKDVLLLNSEVENRMRCAPAHRCPEQGLSGERASAQSRVQSEGVFRSEGGAAAGQRTDANRLSIKGEQRTTG